MLINFLNDEDLRLFEESGDHGFIDVFLVRKPLCFLPLTEESTRQTDKKSDARYNS